MIAKTVLASNVPANRLLELTRLRDDHEYRAHTFATLARLLDELPEGVGDLASIGAAVSGTMTARSVATTRGHIADELASGRLDVRTHLPPLCDEAVLSSTDDRHAIELSVSGFPVGDRELGAALAEEAIDRTIITEALLRALEHDLAVVRIRAAQRVGRMEVVSPSVAGRLNAIVRTDENPDARAAASEALLAHANAVGREAKPQARVQPLGPLATSLRLKPVAMRSSRQVPILLLPLDRSSAPGARAHVFVDEDGLARIKLMGLPDAFVGTRPAVRVSRGSAGMTEIIAVAAQAVDSRGAAVLRVDPQGGSIEEIGRRMSNGVELVVVDG